MSRRSEGMCPRHSGMSWTHNGMSGRSAGLSQPGAGMWDRPERATQNSARSDHRTVHGREIHARVGRKIQNSIGRESRVGGNDPTFGTVEPASPPQRLGASQPSLPGSLSAVPAAGNQHLLRTKGKPVYAKNSAQTGSWSAERAKPAHRRGESEGRASGRFAHKRDGSKKAVRY